MLVIEVASKQYDIIDELMLGSTVISNMLECANNQQQDKFVIPLTIDNVTWTHYFELITHVLSNKDSNIVAITNDHDTKHNVRCFVDNNNDDNNLSCSCNNSNTEVIQDHDMIKITNCIYVIDLLENTYQLRLLYNYICVTYRCCLLFVKGILKNSNFTLTDVDPFFNTKDISHMIQSLNTTGYNTGLLQHYVEHIYNTLYAPYMSKSNSHMFHVKPDSLRCVNSHLTILM